jgi:hypothetical protein
MLIIMTDIAIYVISSYAPIYRYCQLPLPTASAYCPLLTILKEEVKI